jgi:competence protein ComEA
MERTTIVKLVAALAVAAALVALGALLPRPPSALGQASLAPTDSVSSDSPDPGRGDPVLGRASLAPPDSVPSDSPDPGRGDPVLGRASLAPSSLLHVYVCGAVHKAGVYTLPAGARIVDAIARAGGASENGDLEQLNLAEPLADSMKVDVPVKGQQLAVPVGFADSASSFGSQAASPRHAGRHHSSRSGSHKLAAGQTLDINTASESELAQLPGVGPSLARRIVEYRTANGPFQLPDDLQNVSGIGASKFAKMEPFIRV